MKGLLIYSEILLLLVDTRFLFKEQFYKNNAAQIWPKIKNNVRTIQAGIWNHKCKVYFA